MKIKKVFLIIISSFVIFFLLNTVTYKGYYSSVDYRFVTEKIAFLSYNRAYYKSGFYQSERTNSSSEELMPENLQNTKKANVKLTNILNTFYVMRNDDVGPIYHIHIVFMDIVINKYSKKYPGEGISTDVTLLFYQGKDYKKVKNIRNINL